MSLDFYYLSGSPFSWRVWLALEHKAIPYEMHVLSKDKGDLDTIEYRAINPRGKAPAIAHDGFVLYESVAILEYLEEAFTDTPFTLWPQNRESRATARRIVSEIDSYLYPATRRMVEELIMKPQGAADLKVVGAGQAAATSNLEALAGEITGTFFFGDTPCAADFSLYPLIAMLGRIKLKNSTYDLQAAMLDSLKAWKASFENLPYFTKTLPPHWRAAA